MIPLDAMICDTTANTDPARNSAVRAWLGLCRTSPAPRQIEDLKRRAGSNVFRLVGVGPLGSNVIAKRCTKSRARAELNIYREVLPLLPFSSLEYYGLWEEPEGECCWVFIEDAGGVAYSTEAHGVLAAEWLGKMHKAGGAAARELVLPEWGPARYLDSLRKGRKRICENLGNPALGEEDRVVLDAIVTQCGIVERNWSWIDDASALAPWTFVHGDLHPKNLRVRTAPSELTLVAFDWESAGRSVVAVDLCLAGLDIPTYCSVVKASWPRLDVENLVLVGNVFQLLSCVELESTRLSEEWLHKPIKNMKYYLAEMARAIRAAELY